LSGALIPKHGGYRKLKSFQVAELAYDVTVRFRDPAGHDPKPRAGFGHVPSHDQMVQAARSGVQNIAEGSQASGTSRKMELKLTNVARASLEELRRDYEDFLRQRGFAAWQLRDPRRADLIALRPGTADDVALWVKEQSRKGSGQGGQGGQDGRSTMSTESIPAIAANAALTLVVVACSLLDRQIASQATAFEREGGFTERLHRRRGVGRTRESDGQLSTGLGDTPTRRFPARSVHRHHGRAGVRER
jgi:four helix bundle suffix protein